MAFIPAEVLRQSFEVYGKFYKYDLNGQIMNMRSHVQIVRKEIQAEKPDCTVIMINPGSWNPSAQDSCQEKGGLIRAKDNQTQHQLMRLMDRMGYNRLDVINLSDICEGNLKKFFNRMDNFQSLEGDRHSIFTKEREAELLEHIDHEIPIIAGWGTDARIQRLAQQALRILGERKLYGIKHEKHPYYYHPKPPVIKDRIRWLNRMEAQLKGEAVLV
ncbi:DUF1643 domain-containing protein [Siminovitchia sediminis]|uniref:DUF1643 domain-containing protein n=1 Tax=Siminovitchia sediminis TaxID=1274353 RepID=A0ABW4KJC6_9BACI